MKSWPSIVWRMLIALGEHEEPGAGRWPVCDQVHRVERTPDDEAVAIQVAFVEIVEAEWGDSARRREV